jgi:hypothetical protein
MQQHGQREHRDPRARQIWVVHRIGHEREDVDQLLPLVWGVVMTVPVRVECDSCRLKHLISSGLASGRCVCGNELTDQIRDAVEELIMMTKIKKSYNETHMEWLGT